VEPDVKKTRSGQLVERWRWLFWEILIIVVGVLIALGLDGYWSDRNDRLLEVQYLKRIHADLHRDMEWVNGYLNGGISRKFEALEAIAPVVRGRAPVPDDLETFLNHVSLAGLGGVSPNSWVTRTTFDDLKATGNLRLIQDAEMRTRISAYYTQFENNHRRLITRVTGYPELVHQLIPAELRSELNLKAMEEFGVERAIERIQSEAFEDLFNQEYNLAFFMRDTYVYYLEVTRQLTEEFEVHIQGLDAT